MARIPDFEFKATADFYHAEYKKADEECQKLREIIRFRDLMEQDSVRMSKEQAQAVRDMVYVWKRTAPKAWDIIDVSMFEEMHAAVSKFESLGIPSDMGVAEAILRTQDILVELENL